MVLDFLTSIFSSQDDADSDDEPDINQKIQDLGSEIEELRDQLSEKTYEKRIEDNSQSIKNLSKSLEALFEVIESQGGAYSNLEDSKIVKNIQKRVSKLEKGLKTSKMPKNGVSVPENDVSKTSGRPSNRPSVLVSQESQMEQKAENAVKGEELWTKTTPAQKNVLKVLYDSGYPMSYKEVARELDRTVSTVKNHINNLKSMGVRFRETSGKNNSKKYLLDKRIKGFLTMKLND